MDVLLLLLGLAIGLVLGIAIGSSSSFISADGRLASLAKIYNPGLGEEVKVYLSLTRDMVGGDDDDDDNDDIIPDCPECDLQMRRPNFTVEMN